MYVMVESALIKWIGFFIGFLATALSGYFWYDKRKIDDKIKDSERRIEIVSSKIGELRNKQTEHENKFVTEQRTREILKEEIAPLKEDIASVKSLIEQTHGEVKDLVVEIRVSNAVAETRKEMEAHLNKRG